MNLKRTDIKEKIKNRGKIQLIVFENFEKKTGIQQNEMIDIKIYENEEKIIQIYENNIEENKYFNAIIFNYEDKENATKFLKSFVERQNEESIVKNNSDYPFFIFFENKKFNKEILYAYYLENTTESDIPSYYELKSYNLIFINGIKSLKEKPEIKEKLFIELSNYYYEYDFKQNHESSPYNIEILFIGETGCGKSTFINYLLGKLRAYSTSSNKFKSKGGVYTHSKFPITITDSEGYELNSKNQENKILEKLKKNIENELSNRTHIAFYLIPGPFNSNRDLDYSCIGTLLKLEEYNIHYYLIMTKDPDENKNFSKVSLRFLNGIINNKDYGKINSDLNEEKLTEMLGKIRDRLQNRIFSVNVMLKNSKSIKKLMEQINDDLKKEKKNNENFISQLEKKENKKRNVEIDFSGSQILKSEGFIIPEELENSPFFNLKKITSNEEKRKKAKKLIDEAKDVSTIRKIFFCYNSKIRENRKKMLEEILHIYECPHLTIDLIEGRITDKEKNEWFYQSDCTEELGNKIINVCEEEYNKLNDISKYILYCSRYNESFIKFDKYVNEFINFKFKGKKIQYDCELNN